MLPINITHIAEDRLTLSKLLIHYIPIHIYSTALHLDIASTLSSEALTALIFINPDQTGWTAMGIQ